MATDTITRPGNTATFQAASVEAKLRAVLLESMKSTASIQGISLPNSTAAQYAVTIHLDFLEIVSLLCDLEPIVGFELKDSLVRTGGYYSINEAVGHLMPRISAAWQKQAIKGGRK